MDDALIFLPCLVHRCGIQVVQDGRTKIQNKRFSVSKALEADGACPGFIKVQIASKLVLQPHLHAPRGVWDAERCGAFRNIRAGAVLRHKHCKGNDACFHIHHMEHVRCGTPYNHLQRRSGMLPVHVVVATDITTEQGETEQKSSQRTKQADKRRAFNLVYSYSYTLTPR